MVCDGAWLYVAMCSGMWWSVVVCVMPPLWCLGDAAALASADADGVCVVFRWSADTLLWSTYRVCVL